MKIAVPLAKIFLFPLGITAAASVFDAGIQKKTHCYGRLSDSALQTITSIIIRQTIISNT